MTLEQLRIFVAVATLKNINKEQPWKKTLDVLKKSRVNRRKNRSAEKDQSKKNQSTK